MTGRPQREKPKETIRAVIGNDVYISLLPILRNKTKRFYSMSQLVETIVFLSEHVYIVEPDDGFVIGLAKLRHERILAQIGDPYLTRQKCMHVTLDERAVDFLDLLVSKYHMLFKNRSEALELVLYNVSNACRTQKELDYYVDRLIEVMRQHPARRQQAGQE